MIGCKQIILYLEKNIFTLLSTEYTYIYSQWFFLRLMGFIYLVAFISQAVQLKGLWGSQGILPIRRFLASINPRMKWKRFYHIPSIFWLRATDPMLISTNFLAILASLFIILDLLTLPCLILCLIVWLSFLSTAQDFMRRQSDTLIVELGFVTIFYAAVTPPPLPILLLIWFTLFKFIFMAGTSKLLSGDRTWRDGSALAYHYLTQPMPNRISWFAHKMPLWMHKISTYAMFSLEVGVPFLLFIPLPEAHLFLFFLLTLLSLGIFATGNFTFFNLLTIAFAAVLIEDRYLTPWLPEELLTLTKTSTETVENLFWLPALILFALHIIHLIALFFPSQRWNKIIYAINPLHISNRFSMFASMTKVRREVVIEGSRDGEKWSPYEFKWKAGDLTIPPRQMAPHHPRLDWQMWFASLGNYKQFPWFSSLMLHLLKGTPEVIQLLGKNPFPKEPPNFLRAKLYEYNFSSWKEYREKKVWWRRKFLGFYSPTFQRKAKVKKVIQREIISSGKTKLS